MNTNITSRIDSLHAEITSVKVDMASQAQFQELQTRVSALEAKNEPQIVSLKQQLSRLDPANKSVCSDGFVDSDVSQRFASIDNLLTKRLQDAKIMNAEHIFVGSGSERKLSNTCIV